MSLVRDKKQRVGDLVFGIGIRADGGPLRLIEQDSRFESETNNNLGARALDRDLILAPLLPGVIAFLEDILSRHYFSSYRMFYLQDAFSPYRVLPITVLVS